MPQLLAAISLFINNRRSVMNRQNISDISGNIPVVVIIRKLSAPEIDFIAENMVEAGLHLLEITMNTPEACKIIATLKRKFGGKLSVGAGTVCTMADLEQAIDCGAEYIVTPVLVEALVEKAVKDGIRIFPGAFTPSEIYRAWSMGVPMVKLFPANIGGPAYIKDILAPLDEVQLMPSGGITPDNYISYLQAGARAVGMGSNLFPKHLVDSRNADGLMNVYRQVVKQYEEFSGRIAVSN